MICVATTRWGLQLETWAEIDVNARHVPDLALLPDRRQLRQCILPFGYSEDHYVAAGCTAELGQAHDHHRSIQRLAEVVQHMIDFGMSLRPACR
jgi:hypothetical protein